MHLIGKRIGLFGGTFDPVYIGRMRSAVEMAEQPAFDELRLLPNAQPPHRETPQVSAAQRLAMVERAAAGVERSAVDPRELKRDRPPYTIDTLESVRAELAADDQLFMLIGRDAFCGLPAWHRRRALPDHCHIVVLQRPDADNESSESLRDLLAVRSVADPQALRGLGGQITFVWQTSLAMSATQIRVLLGVGRSARFLVPDAILNYIEAHHLYRAPY